MATAGARALVVVGASHAGAQVAASARAAGHAGPIRLIGEEPCLPYQRPPLSKGFLLGKVDAATLPIRAAAFYREEAIDLLPGTRVAAIDRSARTVTTAAGQRIGYDRLVLAVGARPRLPPVPGIALDGVLALRSLADAERLRERLPSVGAAVVIGGGFIGLEVAAALTALGKRVTVLEAQDRLLARAAAAPLAVHVAAVHRARGVDVRLRTTAARIDGADGRTRAVVCDDGSVLPADLVVVGIGVVPETALAAAAGLACTDGVEVDRFASTADPAVLAVGDCCRHPNAYAGRSLRLESVQHAVDQAKAAGATAAGRPTPYEAVPWFWSDQFDMKLQMVGLCAGWTHHVVRGDPATGRFSIFYFRDGRLLAIDSINRAAEHVAGRRLLAAGRSPSADEVADESFDLAAAARA
ncbi:MAG: FAD-dependent oxidoreductase [Alphaproteobacteria bacterium]|nr:FAD-dependent oxidoreductase [Alphaproteobacteria bacterium]